MLASESKDTYPVTSRLSSQKPHPISFLNPVQKQGEKLQLKSFKLTVDRDKTPTQRANPESKKLFLTHSSNSGNSNKKFKTKTGKVVKGSNAHFQKVLSGISP